MKTLLLSLIFPFFSQAGSFTVVGPCHPDPILDVKMDFTTATLGDLTIEILSKNGIAFKGDRSGIKSINNSPVGDEALEIISDTQMRAYGWCVTINGIEPDRMPDEIQLINEPHAKIVWFYAYSLYDRGEWKEFCTPSYKVKSLPYCNVH